MALKVQPLRLNLRLGYLRANIMGAEFLREPRFEPDRDKHRSFRRLRIDMRLGVLAKVLQHLLCCTSNFLLRVYMYVWRLYCKLFTENINLTKHRYLMKKQHAYAEYYIHRVNVKKLVLLWLIDTTSDYTNDLRICSMYSKNTILKMICNYLVFRYFMVVLKMQQKSNSSYNLELILSVVYNLSFI